MLQPERIIQDRLMAFLMSRGALAFMIKTTASYDPKIGRFRKCSRWYRRGVSDILGIYLGKFIALEVKTKKGYPSELQKLFLNDVHKAGGYGAVVRCEEDVDAFLKRIDQDLRER